MPAPQNEPNPEPFDDEDFPPLEELLKYATLDQILYGVHMSMDGGEEISYVETEPPADGTNRSHAPDAPPSSAPPPGAEPA